MGKYQTVINLKLHFKRTKLSRTQVWVYFMKHTLGYVFLFHVCFDTFMTWPAFSISDKELDIFNAKLYHHIVN